MQPFLCAFFVTLGLAVPAWCQPRPGAFSTIVTTNTSVASACIGANTINAPTTCLGGLQAGPTVVNQALTLPSFTPGVVTNKLYNVGGNLFFNGLALATGGSVGPGTANVLPVFTGVNSIGNSLFSQSGTIMTLAGTFSSTVFGTSVFAAGGVGDEALIVRNTSAGVANRGVLFVGNDTAVNLGALAAHASTFTTTGAAIANGVKLEASGAGGLSLLASDAAGIIHFFTGTGTVERGQITAAGLFQWTTFGTHIFTGGGAGTQILRVTNVTAGAGNSASVQATSDTVLGQFTSTTSTFTTAGPLVQASTVLAGDGAGGLSLAATHATGAVRIYTGSGTLRATVDAAGNFNLGSTNIMDSPAVPTLTTVTGGTATIAGRNTAFRIGISTGPVSLIAVAFNMTYTNIPACVATTGSVTAATVFSNPSTTEGIFAFTPSIAAGTVVNVLCRGL